jgi:hypothetical protein
MGMRRARTSAWFVALLVIGVVVTIAVHRAARAHDSLAGQSAPSSTSSAPSTDATPSPKPSSKATKAPGPSPRTQLNRLLAALPKGTASVAAVDLRSGARYSGGSQRGQWTASVYKLFLVQMLWQANGAHLSGSQQADAAAAIEHSDNVAGWDLYVDVGMRAGETAGIKALRLTHTVAGGTDPTFTTTSAQDCITLLREVAKNPYALGLMRQVERDQRWGVSAAADAGASVALKNGWLQIDDDNGPGEEDDGRWVVNSIGIVPVHGHQVLLAVLTQHNPDLDTGISLVQRLAKLAAATVSP